MGDCETVGSVLLRAFMRRTLATTAEDTPGGKQLQERSSMSSRVNWGEGN